MQKKYFLSGFMAFLVLFIVQQVFSQQVERLTLNDCIKIALKNNSTLRNAKRRVQMAGTDVTTATSNFLPSLSLSLSSGRFVQGARVVKQDVPVDYDPITGRIIYEQKEIYQKSVERNYNQARVSLSQNIFDFGRSINGLKQARAQREASNYTMISTKQAVVLNVKQAYYELLKAIHLQEVYEGAVKLAEEQLKRAQTMMEIGLASQAEVYQAKVNLGSNQRNLLTQKNLVAIARANLNNALGRDPGIPVDVIEDETEPTFPDYSFEDAIKIAIDNNQEIKALELQAKADLYSYRVARARYMPTIGAALSYTRNNDEISRVYTTNLDQDFSANIGVQFDLNIFNGLADKAAVQRQALAYQMALEDLQERKRTLTVEVKQHFLELKAYKDFLEINRQNIEASKENLRLQQEKRRVGSGTELEVTQAQVELTQAQSDYVSAKYEAKIVKARLEATMGKLVE